MIYPSVGVKIVEEPDQIAAAGGPGYTKPFVRITNPDGTLELTFNQFGMLFGGVKGAAARLVEQGKLPANNVPPEWLE